MKDINGEKVNVGDFVVYVTSAALRTGHITKIYKNDWECSVNNNPHIYSYRIMKLPENLNA